MQDRDQELIRRVLESVLRRLEQRAPVAVSQATSVANLPATTNEQPMIFIVLGNLEQSQDGAHIHSSEAIKATTNEAMSASSSTLPGIARPHSVHPGLEKFPLAEEPANRIAPKTCFMEPDRICVHSGACEMRGH